MSWVRELLISSGVATPQTLLGLSPSELVQAEEGAGRALPLAYRTFLSEAGKLAGRLGEDIELYYPDVLELTEEAKEMIEECGMDYSLPADAFVFCGYQGYQYLFFRCNEDNPAVWRLSDDGPPPEHAADSFSEFLNIMVETTPKA